MTLSTLGRVILDDTSGKVILGDTRSTLGRMILDDTSGEVSPGCIHTC